MEVWAPCGDVTITKIVPEGKKYVKMDFEQDFFLVEVANFFAQYVEQSQKLCVKKFYENFYGKFF